MQGSDYRKSAMDLAARSRLPTDHGWRDKKEPVKLLRSPLRLEVQRLAAAQARGASSTRSSAAPSDRALRQSA